MLYELGAHHARLPTDIPYKSSPGQNVAGDGGFGLISMAPCAAANALPGSIDIRRCLLLDWVALRLLNFF